jgi:hypothetical protein
MKPTIGVMLAFVSVFGPVLMFATFAGAAEECCNFQVNNKTSSTLKFFANGVYMCTAQAKEMHPKDYCTAQVPTGTPISATVQWPDGKTRAAQTTVSPGKFVTWTVED